MHSILDTLGLFLEAQSTPLTLAFDADGGLSGFFGNPLMFGIDAENLAEKRLEEILPALYGLNLRERKHLDMIALGDGAPADIHIIPHRDGVNVVLVDKSVERARQQKVQQRLHNLELSTEKSANQAQSASAERMLTLAHEIRNPLFSISGYCDWIMRTLPTDPSVNDKVAVINTNAHYLLGLVERLLERRALGTERDEPLPLRAVRIAELADDVRSLYTIQVAEKGIGFNIYHERPDTRLMLDADKLKQILINIVGNAVKYTESGGISILFNYQDSALEILVEDTGIGIRAGERDLVTRPFFRSEQTSHLPGVGIGLSVTKALLDLMHGEMTIQSIENWGTTIKLRIPCEAASESVTADFADAAGNDDGAPIALSDAKPSDEHGDDGALHPIARTLLLIDDDPDILALIEFYLVSDGHRVVTASPDSLQEIVAAFHACNPDIVILDLQLHHAFDGIDVVRAFREANRTAATILLTGIRDPELNEAALDAGFNLVLNKPIHRADLLNAVASFGA